MTIEQRLVKDLGTTTDPTLAVWMLRDGTYVNGSYEGHQRDVDHHEISRYYRRSKRHIPGSYGIYVYKFMARGNIRVGCSDSGWCYELGCVPSREQADQLYKAIINARKWETEAYFGRNPRGSEKPIWESDTDFLWYLNRYTDYYPPVEIQNYYYEWVGKPLIDYGY